MIETDDANNPTVTPLADTEGIYEAAAVVVHAVDAAGPNASAASINQAMAATDIQLPSGTVKFGPDRLRVNPPIYLGKIENNSQELIKTL